MNAERNIPTERRIAAVELLLSQGWTWDGYSWIYTHPQPARSGVVSDEMVAAYVSAVNDHLGNMTEAEWQADRLDKDAHLDRVARIGLTAAIQGSVSDDARDAARYRWLRKAHESESPTYGLWHVRDYTGDPVSNLAASLDYAIDAAMQGESHVRG